MNSSFKRKPLRQNAHSPAGNSISKNMICWAPPVIWAAFIFYLSGRTASDFPEVGLSLPFADKAVHFLLYAILGFLLARSFARASAARGRVNVIILAVATAVAWGAADEMHQFFVPTRALDFTDLLADAIGATFGAIIWSKYIE